MKGKGLKISGYRKMGYNPLILLMKKGVQWEP